MGWRDKAIPVQEGAPAAAGASSSSWRERAVPVVKEGDQYDPSGLTAPSPPPSLENYTPEALAADNEFNGVADSAMYDEVNLEEAERRFKQASEDPRNANKVIPPVRKASPLHPRNLPLVGGLFDNGPYAVPLGDKIASGAVNAGVELAKTAAAGVDTGMNAVYDAFGIDAQSKGAEFIDQNTRQLKAGDAGDEFVQMIPQAVVGGVIGKKLLGTSKPGLDTSRWARAARFARNEAAIAAGAGAALAEDTDTLVVGKDKMFGTLWDPGKDADYNEKVIAGKLNLFAEGLMGSGAAVGATELGGFITKFFKTQIVDRALGGVKASTAENRMFDMFVNATSGIEHMTDQQKQIAARAVMQIARENKDVVLKGIKESSDVTVELDPLAAVEAGLRAQGDDVSAHQVKQQRDAIFGRGDRGTSGKILDYDRSAGAFQENLYSDTGGAGAVEDARAGLVESGLQDVQIADDVVTSANQSLKDAEANILETLRTDQTFGGRIQEIEAATGINISEGTNQTLEDMATKIARAQDIMAQQRAAAYKEAYDAAPDGVEIEPDSMFKIIADMQEEGTFAKLPPLLKSMVKEMGEDITGETLDPRLVDFKWLHSELVPELSKRIASALRTNDPAADGLIALKRNITQDQVEYISQIAEDVSPDFAAKWQTAVDTNQEYMNFFGQGMLKKINETNRTIVPTNPTTSDIALDTNTEMLGGAFGNAKRNEAGAIVRLLDTEEGGKSSGLITDFIIGRTAQNLGSAIRTKGAGALDVESFISEMKDEASVLYKNFPDEAARLETFFTSLRAQKDNIPALEEAITVATRKADEARDQILNKELGRFFGDTGRPVTDAQAIFDGVLKGKESSDVLQQMMDRANRSDNPELIKSGLQAAFAKHLKFDPASIKSRQDDLLKYAEILYPDDPRAVEGTQRVFELMESTRVGKAPENLVGRIPQVILNESTDAVGKIITATFGVLNHMGAVVRGATMTGLKSVDPAQRAAETLDAMHSNFPEFIRLGEQYVKSLETGINVQKTFDEFSRYMSKYALTSAGSPQYENQRAVAPVAIVDPDSLEDTEEPTGGTLEPTGRQLPEAPSLPPVSDPQAPVEDLEATEEGFPEDSFMRLEDRDRQPLINSQRSRFPEGIVATWEF